MLKNKLVTPLIAAIVLFALAGCGQTTADNNPPNEYSPPEHIETPAEETPQISAYITILGQQFSTELTTLGLDWLDLTNEEIAPLRYMVNLEELFLETSQIDDITPLTWLTNLEFLLLYSFHLEDLTPLAGLTNLTGLGLIGKVTTGDITPLAQLANLETLTLSGITVSDLTPLESLTNLWALTMVSNQIIDISSLAQLTKLEVFDSFDNPITDWSPVDHVVQVWGRPDNREQ